MSVATFDTLKKKISQGISRWETKQEEAYRLKSKEIKKWFRCGCRGN